MAKEPSKRLRCAIYTRKSSEEGLEQEFNSLDAQREAGEAYVRSQAHEGWTLIKTAYDDGGFSGGNVDRPGLKMLMADIKAGKIDIVVVYKVDRLTRSLSDFAQLIQTFETHGTSFVSVTQQFNTTTSMGRLMLNVLLSFAQFEREVTGERIRDKIAASKKKGMWMGGVVPMGYVTQNRKLIIKEEDAEIIQHIFRRYAALGTVSSLMHELRAQGIKTRKNTSESGRSHGGCFFSRGHLYAILKNKIYLGEIIHKGTAHPGEHDAIIDEELWKDVQATLAVNRRVFKSDIRTKSPSLLKGLIFDSAGNKMSPSHGQRGKRRYRYYVSRALLEDRPNEAGLVPRLPAHEVEMLVEREVLSLLTNNEGTKRKASELSNLDEGPRRSALRTFINKVTIEKETISLEILLDNQNKTQKITLPFRCDRRGGKSKLISKGDKPLFDEGPRESLVNAIARAWNWRRKLETGSVLSLTAIAESEGVTLAYVTRLLRFAWLAPDILEAILNGKAPNNFSGSFLRRPIPLDWNEQRKAFGFETKAA